MIGQVSSQPMSVLLAQALENSDNVLAEALARQVAIARGAPPSFAGASAAIIEALEDLKIDTIGVELYDGSGISTKDRVPPAVLAQVGRAGGQGRHPGAAEPADRTAGRRRVRQPGGSVPGPRIQGRGGLGQGEDRIARGHLRAGRLRPDVDGRIVVFAFVSNGVGVATRPALDALAAGLRGCGCA